MEVGCHFFVSVGKIGHCTDGVNMVGEGDKTDTVSTRYFTTCSTGDTRQNWS